jgi:hypothetical protein
LLTNLGGDLHPIGWIGELRREFGRPKEPTILNGIERSIGQKVQRAGLAKIDSIMLKNFVLQITKINPHRLGAQLQKYSAEPRLKLRRILRCRQC